MGGSILVAEFRRPRGPHPNPGHMHVLPLSQPAHHLDVVGCIMQFLDHPEVFALRPTDGKMYSYSMRPW